MRGPMLVSAMTLVACAPQRPLPINERPMGWADHMEAAQEYDRAAAEELQLEEQAEAAGPVISCTTAPVLNEQLTSGTEVLSPWPGCWNTSYESAALHDYEARVFRERADRHRAIADQMLDDARRYCQTIPEDEPSLLSDPEIVDLVVPLRDEDGRIRGARIVLAPDAPAAPVVANAVSCYRARFAVQGMDHKYMSTDPTIVEGVDAVVVERDGRVEVIVQAADQGDALTALWRAEDLARPAEQTATR